jgi:hypothetical protein
LRWKEKEGSSGRQSPCRALEVSSYPILNSLFMFSSSSGALLPSRYARMGALPTGGPGVAIGVLAAGVAPGRSPRCRALGEAFRGGKGIPSMAIMACPRVRLSDRGS